MHRREITKLYARTKQDGLTLVPLSLYFKDSRVKVELGLCKGKSSMTSATPTHSAAPNARSTER